MPRAPPISLLLPIYQPADVKRESDMFGVSVPRNPIMEWLNIGAISLCEVCESCPVGGIRVGMGDVRSQEIVCSQCRLGQVLVGLCGSIR